MLKLLMYSLISILIFSGCDRALNTDTTRLTIQLPSSAANAVSSESHFMQSLNINILNLDTQYLEILPTGFGSGTAPVNCYFVTVAGPEEAMNVNYCGKIDSDGQLSKDHTFGTHLGYVSAVSTVTVEVPTGRKRVVKLFGFYVTSSDQCKDIADDPNRNAMSYPYYVGKSGETDLDGTSKVVTVQLENPSSNNRMDDCQIRSESPLISEADAIGIEKNDFPYGYARVPISAGFTCEPVSFSLYNGGIDKKPAALLSRSNYEFQVSVDGTNFESRNLHPTYAACQFDVLSSTTFSISAFREKTEKWIRLSNGDSSITHFRASSIGRLDIAATASPVNFSSVPTVFYVFDLIGMPDKIVSGACYPFRIGYRDLYGQFPALVSSTDISIHTKYNGTTISTAFFTDPACTSSTSSVVLPNNQSLSTNTYYMRLISSQAMNNKLAEFEVIKNSGGPAGLVATTKIPVRLIFNSTNTPVLSKISFSGLKYIATNGSDRCVPLTINLLDQNGLPYITDGSISMEILTESFSNMQGVTIYNDKECTATALIGDPVLLGASDTQITYFLGVSSSTTSGPRKAIFSTTTNVVKEFLFNIIDK